MADNYDLVIRGGTIVDGSGERPYTGDVGIHDGWIAATGIVRGCGKEEINAKGLLVTPGFIDIHTHYDGQLIWSDRVAPSSNHGVTTVVTGNCGIGFAPCRPQDRSALIKLMEGVEDIPGAVTAEGLTWDWESFPDFLSALERRPHDIDMGVYLPHSPLRVFVMGDRALRREPATADDKAQMRRLAREALAAGAAGFATSRMRVHRSSTGELIPTYGVDVSELTEIAQELRAARRGVFQLVTDVGYVSFGEMFPLMVDLARSAGRPVTFTHPQSPDWREAVKLIDDANREPGVNLKGQLLPRPVGMMLGLTVSAHPFCTTPSYLKIKDLPLSERVAQMRKPEVRAAILSEPPLDPTNPLIGFTRRYEVIFVTGATINYEPPISDSVAALAVAQGRSPEEVVYDELLKDNGNGMLILMMGNYEERSLDWMETLLKSSNIVLGLGDGGAHYGMVCDASYSTFALSHWTRDRPHGRVPLESMIYRLTAEPAGLMGFHDRGLVSTGYLANLNIVDYDRLALHKPEVISDLPAGGKRLNQRADGYVATIVRGKVIMRKGEPTKERPGKLLRGVQSPRERAPIAALAE